MTAQQHSERKTAMKKIEGKHCCLGYGFIKNTQITSSIILSTNHAAWFLLSKTIIPMIVTLKKQNCLNVIHIEMKAKTKGKLLFFIN